MTSPSSASEQSSIPKAFGQVLRRLRLERNLTQQELADASGYHLNHISFLERGRRSPNLVVVFDLASALGLTPAQLIDQVDQTNRHLLGGE